MHMSKTFDLAKLPSSVTVDASNNLVISNQLETPIIDTSDSSPLTITPPVTFNADVNVENDLIVANKITATGTITGPTTDTLLIKNSAGTTLKTIRGV